MPILAVCPYCHEGKVRAPNHAVGLSATCPRCQSCFTIVASEEPKTPQTGPAAVRAAAPPAKPIGSSAVVATTVPKTEFTNDERLERAVNDTAESTVSPPVTVLPPARPMPVYVPEKPKPEFSFVLGLIAVIVAGVALAASMIPIYGRIVLTVIAFVGLMLSGVSLLTTEKKYLVPALSAAANGLALLMAVALGRWIGLGPWLPERSQEDPRIVKAVSYSGEEAIPAEWVDISKAAWQQDDVRVTVKASSIAPLELAGPGGKKKWTKEKYLQVWIQIKNSGVARPIEFRGWPLVELPNDPIPQLRDSTGKTVPLKKFEGEWRPEGRPEPKMLFPGKTSEQLLIFELPEPKIDYLQLELPAGAFGGTEPVRLMIPRGSILYRS